MRDFPAPAGTEPTRSRAPWSPLPRETRDTLFLLGVIGWTVMPHLGHVPLWCAALTLAMLGWRAWLALRQAPLPGRWTLVLVLAGAAIGTYASHRTLLGKEAGVTMAVALMALKTLELRARRDAFVVFFLGFFLVLTHFLYSQSIAVAGAMVVSVWGLLTALVLAHMPVGQPHLARAARLAARTALLGAPIVVLLFVLFPRVGPLWGVPQDGLAATGLSNTMQLGSVAEVAQDDRIALRLRFFGSVPPARALYFRGPVLSRFDGREWRTDPASLVQQPPPDFTPGDAPLRYEITLEPQRIAALPVLEATLAIGALDGYVAHLAPDLQWLADRPVLDRLRFEGRASLAFAHGASLSRGDQFALRQLPLDSAVRTRAWARELKARPELAGADAAALARAVLAHVRSGGYTYTLAPGRYGETDPRTAIDEFWLDRKEGFCEHFAAAFVVAMRAMGVPARIVTGFQGMEPVPVDGYYVVRQSAAHAWAEYWQPGVGWRRADPTAAVAPERVERARNLVPPPGLVAGAIGTVNPALLAQWRAAWEQLNNRWNQWVLNYSRGQQTDLLKQLGIEAPSWQDVARLLVAALSALAAAGAAWAWWDRHRVDPWTRQGRRLRAALARLGLDALPHEPPRALARRVRERLGEEAGMPLAELLDELDRQRYGPAARPRPDQALTRRFVAAARRLPRAG